MNVAVEGGYRNSTPESLVEVVDGEGPERSVDPGEWRDLLASEFGPRYPEA